MSCTQIAPQPTASWCIRAIGDSDLQRRAMRQCLWGAALLLLATLHTAVRPAEAKDKNDTPGAKQVLTVGASGADHTSIQAAIDAARDGATIKIAEGSFEGPLVIKKSVSFVGTGWKTTLVSTKKTKSLDTGNSKSPMAHSTMHIIGPHRVSLEGLRLSNQSTAKAGGTILTIDGSKVIVTACAFVEAPSCGVVIVGDADVQMKNSLVSSVKRTGIAIGPYGAGMPKVHIEACDIRYGHHRCVTIGTGCNEVVIAGSRISGSGWHGIRYDDASPKIIGNRIVNNVRSAIYASGRTRARVEGNLLAGTGMGAMGCWARCSDLILSNTFADNKRAGIEILGGSNPNVLKNIFVGNPVGIRWSTIGGQGSDRISLGRGAIRGNCFWKNDRIASKELRKGVHNVEKDPNLGGDYNLPADSRMRLTSTGASSFPTSTSPFPELPEEIAARKLFEEHMAKHAEGRKVRAPTEIHETPNKDEARKLRRDAATKLSRTWTSTMRSLKDLDARAKAIEEINASLRGNDETRLLASLFALRWSRGVKLDADAMRIAILPHASSKDYTIRRAAREALVAVKVDPSDVSIWIQEAHSENPSNPETTAQFLVMAAGGEIQGEVADAILHLLRDDKHIRKAFVIRGLSQRAKSFDPRVEKRLIEIVRSVPASSYDSAYYFHFITPRLDPKSDAVIDVMLWRLAEGKSSAQTVLRGFQRGLSDAQKKRVADELLKYAANATNEHFVNRIVQALPWVADSSHATAIEALKEWDGMTDRLSKRIEEVARRLKNTRAKAK